MSTVPEAIAARHMGMEVLGISCITNAAAGVLPQPLDHNEVMAVAARVRGEFSPLLEGLVERLWATRKVDVPHRRAAPGRAAPREVPSRRAYADAARRGATGRRTP